MIKSLNPDIVTLDIEMPGMNGIDFLERIMRLRPMPVVMVSTLTAAGTEASLAALQLGAVDCVDKNALRDPQTDIAQQFAALVRNAGRSGRQMRGAAPIPPARPAADYRPRDGAMIAIGSSTGGVEALIALLADFPANCPPTVIVQHMPATFTPSFAARLDRLSAPTVEQARPGAVLSTGRIYLAPGGEQHLEIAGTAARRHCRLVQGDRVNGHRPSVDQLFHSVTRIAGADAAGAILTGMGNDGAEGLKAMRTAGSATFGQDRATSVVYGMPAVAFDIGAVTEQLPLRRIAGRLLDVCRA
jgi:two-component system chemotaxis response regulator CheB